MNKRQLTKIAVSSEAGKLQRVPTALAILEAAGPMTDKAISQDLERLDPTIADPMDAESKQEVKDFAVNRTQVILYGLQRKGEAEKLDTGEWAAI